MQSESADYERVLLVKPEVFVYKIPPRTSNRAYRYAIINTYIEMMYYWFINLPRAADWKLDAPDWSGRLRIVSLGAKCVIKLEDKNNGKWQFNRINKWANQ